MASWPGSATVVGRGKKRLGFIIGGLAALLGLGFVGWWLSAPSIEDLLASDSPTPQQIRQIVLSGLTHSDIKIRSRATDKLAGLGEKAKPVLGEIAAHSGDSELRYAALSVLRGVDSGAAAQVMSQMAQ